MKNRQQTLRSKVLQVLQAYPETRNDDQMLTTTLWQVFYNVFVFPVDRAGRHGNAVFIDDTFRLPREDAVKRIRASIQNDKTAPVEDRYLPTRVEVVRRRKQNEAEWLEWARTLNR